MPSILALKRRIQVAQNVSKTTRAMQMIAASKLKKAQSAAVEARPYVEKLTQVAENAASRVEKENLHPYMKGNLSNKSLVVIISPDKGLAGSLISNLIKETLNFNKETLYLTIGRKAELASVRLGHEITASFRFGTTLPSFGTVYPIFQVINEYFLNEKIGKVMIVSSKFENIFSQKSIVTQLLPITLATKKEESVMLFEPNLEELLPNLLRHFIEMTIYQNILESYASEQAARMIAMKNATDNANDLVDELKHDYNKGRQEKITNEILDISSATFALL